MKKYEKFGGLNMPLPMIYGNPQGRSATFSSALANKTNSQIKAFTLTRVTDYSLANIANEVLEASQGDADAFMRAATTEIDGAIQAVTNSIASALYRSGTGTIAQINGGSVTATTITLKDPSDIVNFEVGMTIGASSSDGSGARSGSQAITAIDRGLGTITGASNWDTAITSLGVNDYLFVVGDMAAKLSGLAAWIPSSAPAATAFFGVDRTADVVRLSGFRKSYVGVPIEEALIDLANNVGLNGGSPDYCFMSFQNYANLIKALGSKVMYVDLKSDAGVGFQGVKVYGPKGQITVVPDTYCPSSKMYMLQMDTWQLASLGMAPKLLKSDGMEFLRVSSADAVEVRVGAYLQLGCVAPGFNGVGVLS